MKIEKLLADAYKKGYLDSIVEYRWTTNFLTPVDYDVEITLKIPSRIKDSKLRKSWILLWEKHYSSVITNHCPNDILEIIKDNLDRRGTESKKPIIKKGGHSYESSVNTIIDSYDFLFYGDIIPTLEERLQNQRDSWF